MVKDVTDATFEAEVLERSKEVPVVVDFWAEWCGPCRALGPVLEQATQAREGKVELAKVDTDVNPRVSAAFRIQGIPAVKAFKDGQLVAEFVGAQPPPVVEKFFDALVPSEADALVAEGGEVELRRALELEPDRRDAAVALARLLLARGDRDEALDLVRNVPGFAAEGIVARAALDDGTDPEVTDAFAAIDRGEPEAGLESLVAAIAAASDADRRETLRRAVVGVLDELGVAHPVARDTRRKLASALY